MSRRSWWVVFGAVALASGCQGPSKAYESGARQVRIDPSMPPIDLRADVNRNGTIELDTAADDTAEDTWDAQHGAIFLANIDDDAARCKATDANGRQLSDTQLPNCNDATDEVVNGTDDEADLAPLAIVAWPDAPQGTSVRLVVDPLDTVRIFRKTNSTWEAIDLDQPLPLSDLLGGATLGLEGRDISRDASKWDGFVTLELNVTVPPQARYIPGSYDDTIRLRVAPVLTFPHTLPVETAYATSMPVDPRSPSIQDPDSRAFISGLRTHLTAARPMATLVAPVVFDQWTQDFFETGYASIPGRNGDQHVMRVFFRSANIEADFNSRGLRQAGRIVFSLFRGKDVAGVQQIDMNSPDESQSLNSFGNFETIPPYSVGTKEWKLGRVIRGAVDGFAPDHSFVAMTESQKYQEPSVNIDTSWLLVGHIDETISFLKANSPRGWIVLVNDARMARQILQDQVTAGNGGVRLFAGQQWVDEQTGQEIPAETTISRLLGNTAVMTASAEAAVKVDEQLAILKRETGITDAEIVKVPFLHEDVQGTSLAHQPGTVNLFVIDDRTLVVPDPHGPVIDGKDLFKTQMETALAPYGYTIRWLDDWNLYHRNAGEVHCGTNAMRAIPSTKWWEVTP